MHMRLFFVNAPSARKLDGLRKTEKGNHGSEEVHQTDGWSHPIQESMKTRQLGTIVGPASDKNRNHGVTTNDTLSIGFASFQYELDHGARERTRVN